MSIPAATARLASPPGSEDGVYFISYCCYARAKTYCTFGKKFANFNELYNVNALCITNILCNNYRVDYRAKECKPAAFLECA